MLSRFIFRPSSSSSHLRFLTLISSNPSFSFPPPPLTNDDTAATRSSHPRLLNPNSRHILETFRHFSSNRNNNNNNNGDDNGNDPSISGSWKISPENDNVGDSIFKDDDDDNGNLAGMLDDNGDFNEGSVKVNDRSWSKDSSATGDVFDAIDKEFGLKKGGAADDDDWKTADGYKPWSFVDDEKVEVFDIGEEIKGMPSVENEVSESETSIANKQLELEEERLSAQLKGPNRAFGDLIAASGITDVEIDSLILLKNVEHVEGLPPLSVIEDLRLERNERKSTRAEIERKKQEEVAKARVRQVDEKGRAYGTGRRKCSIARVWIQPGDGKFLINDKQFDVYFPLLDHRANLLRPFSETKTLGLWDVKCTVKGGGVSGQVGAVRLGISRALQNWEPGLRPYLRSEGFLTRDSRVVERKKPGKAKARKSFQWVKR